MRVRHGRDPRVRVVLGHPQRERTPSAAELEDALAVRELRALRGNSERRVFGAIEIGHTLGPEGRAVLAPVAEHVAEERARHFVVLLVGEMRNQRDRRSAHRGDKSVGLRGRGRGIVRGDLGQPRLQQPANADAHQAVGHHAAFRELQCQIRQGHRPLLASGQGPSCLVMDGYTQQERFWITLARAVIQPPPAAV